MVEVQFFGVSVMPPHIARPGRSLVSTLGGPRLSTGQARVPPSSVKPRMPREYLPLGQLRAALGKYPLYCPQPLVVVGGDPLLPGEGLGVPGVQTACPLA